MRAILILAVFIAGHASATDWRSADGFISLSVEPGNFYRLQKNGIVSYCKMFDWPVTDPVGIIKCEDGSFHAFEIVSDSEVRVDGHAAPKVK